MSVLLLQMSRRGMKGTKRMLKGAKVLIMLEYLGSGPINYFITTMCLRKTALDRFVRIS